MNPNTSDELLAKLRTVIEALSGLKLRKASDFEALSEFIFQKTHEKVSPTTLKRLWGYLDDGVTPRKSTLDLLVQSAGFTSWNDFCQQNGEQPTESKRSDSKRPTLKKAVVALLAVIALVVVAVGLWHFPTLGATAEKRLLTKGQTFATADEYLHLFGIHANDTLWFQAVPNLEHLYVWGPQYQHPVWHNEGDPQLLMPTITEYWHPADADSTEEVRQLIEKINRDGYYLTQRTNDLRITFMRSLRSAADTAYVFLGVYRFSSQYSDTTRAVWERVADECDLNNLHELLELRK